MAKRVQLIRYTTAALQNITGKNGELIINLSKRSVTVHDGATPGGFEQARADVSNVPNASSSAAGRMSTTQFDDLYGVIADLAQEIVDRAAADALKADKIAPSAVNNVATLNVSGNLLDSGKTMAQHLAALIPPGTKMVFAQAAAPTGWTQDATNDRMMRVVSGAGGGVGGADSPILNNKVPGHTHNASSASAGAHTHNFRGGGYTSAGTYFNASIGGLGPGYSVTSTDSVVSAGSHTHAITVESNTDAANWAPKYINVILATKN